MTNNEKITEFLKHSNYIEKEYSQEALEDALKAWEYAYKYKNTITFQCIIQIHSKLMQRLRPDIAGKLRDCDVWIGGVKKRFINYNLLRDDIKNWIKQWCNWPLFNTDQIKLAHIEFEKIHPFEDGNGRVGRILYNVQRLRNGYPIHIIHEGKEQMEYYKWFETISLCENCFCMTKTVMGRCGKCGAKK